MCEGRQHGFERVNGDHLQGVMAVGMYDVIALFVYIKD
jgi:hypothetical protein